VPFDVPTGTNLPSFYLPEPVASAQPSSSSVISPLESIGLPNISAGPVFTNSTSSVAYGVPTPRVVRELKASESAKAPSTGVAGKKSVFIAALFLGLMAAAYFV
jgi:hypothetical protein